jgi:hypothetical protein
VNAPQVHFLDHYTDLTEPWQRFWYGQNRPSGFSEDYCKIQYAKYTASDSFITDYHGSDVAADYINGTNLDKEAMKIKLLYCGGNPMTGKVGRIVGTEWVNDENGGFLRLSYLNAFTTPPVGVTRQSHPWYIHEATIISSAIPGTAERFVNPFVNFGGRNTGIGVNYPFMGNPSKIAVIPLAWLRKLAQDEPIPSPYNPPMVIG